jgi:quinol-cytochrome oxidoreductase complex cytochrome b subunit
MRVNTQIATPPTAAISNTSSATAPPLTELSTVLVCSVDDVVDSSVDVDVVRRDEVVVAFAVVVVVFCAVVTVVAACALVVVARAVVVVGFAVVATCSVVVVSSARAPLTPRRNATIAPSAARRRSARRT